MEIIPVSYPIETEMISNAIRNLAESGKESSTILFQVVDFVAPRMVGHSLKYGDCSHILSLYETIKDRCPNQADSFALFLCKFGPFKLIESNSAVVFKKSDKKKYGFPKSFKQWCSKNKEEITVFKNTIKTENKFIEITGPSIREIPGIHCYDCGKRFDKTSSETIETHNCISRQKGTSVITVSGGGGPGTGKRR